MHWSCTAVNVPPASMENTATGSKERGVIYLCTAALLDLPARANSNKLIRCCIYAHLAITGFPGRL